MRNAIRTFAAIVAGSVCIGAQAAWTPLQLAIFAPAQFLPTDWDVCGLRLNVLYGDNVDLWGLDAGTVAHCSGTATGIQVSGLVNLDAKGAECLQVAGLVNVDQGTVAGLQIAGIANVCAGADAVYALQVAPINVGGPMGGVQIGVINTAQKMNGLQIGVVNHAGKLSGAQIGVVNINAGGSLVFFPILNVGF